MTTSDKPRSETRTADEEIQRLREEVSTLQEQLRHTQRLAAVGTMAAMVAHEFNNILTPVINYAQMAQRNPSLVPKAIDRAADGGKRATDICRALLSLARRDRSAIEDVDLSGVTEATLSAMARNPEKDGIDLILSAREPVVIPARTVEVQQVVLNLILNARQAVLSKDGAKRIEITITTEGDQAVWRIADTGVGIPAENVTRIFLPFFSTFEPDDKQTQEQGHGLGLTVCQEIVKAMDGDILVESTPGQGSCFTVLLPLNV
jgi:signal transduction histidine kinase